MSFTLTPNAGKRIASLLQENSEKAFFRISVLGGGCSGFQYDFSLANEKEEEDESFILSGVPLLVDRTSLAFLEGITLDYVEDLMGSSFQITNPNATTTCGCKNSFSI